jgi:mannose-6-phosphate isomerase-like protein (cupin superfamily)
VATVARLAAVRRRPALVPLSHDHHHALVEARRLRRAAEGPEAAAAAAAFLRFFRDDSVRHFREEEELLFPLVADVDEAREPVVRALLEHQRLHALAAELDEDLAGGDAPGETMEELGRLLHDHVRYEERVLFPLIENVLGDALPPELPRGRGESEPGWAAASEDLNATRVAWSAGDGPPEHVNPERDVLLVVLDGSASVVVDGEESRLEPGEATIVGKGRTRLITAGPGGVRYLSVHRRRPPLQIEPRQPEG